MEFSILYAIQGWHTPWLDQVMRILTDMVGGIGQLWLVIALVLCLFKKTRRCGVTVLLSYILVLLAGQLVLKGLIVRPRPCQIDQAVALLVEHPTGSSCPSTHTAWSFAGAAAIWMNHKKWGIAAGVFALVVAFSRLYLFVHFPSDVLIGALLGVACGVAAVYIVRGIGNAVRKRRKKADTV